MKQLSEHDKAILRKIERLDEDGRGGMYNWPAIQHLADQLEDQSEKSYWNDQCKYYNHLAEALTEYYDG